ncbi:MAG: D-sedoheptulose 7-phosphate isomerase [Melioribacteraceae bacterium]|nr:D-sedoheptulose 7-phosphate isomerase [Melioribacteraceae bacterium]
MHEQIDKELDQHRETLNKVKEELSGIINEVSEILVSTIKSGNKILLFGNGGSAADAQHIAAELSGRYRRERKGLPALALTTDTSALTAISNDYGFEYTFARQVEALAKKGDAIIGISTSGNSENVVQGILKGKEIGCELIGLSGKDGGKLKTVCDFNIIIPSESTARIQEMHILIGHIFCEIIEYSI